MAKSIELSDEEIAALRYAVELANSWLMGQRSALRLLYHGPALTVLQERLSALLPEKAE